MALTPRTNAYRPASPQEPERRAGAARGTVGAERGRALLIAANLIVAGWAFGAVQPDTRFLLAALNGATFVACLLPWGRPPGLAVLGGASPLRRLLRFPVFWLGLVMVGYVLLQAFHPEFRRVEEMRGSRLVWWLNRLPGTAGWDGPTSILAPAREGNVWTFLARYGGAWLLVCAAWVGLSRRSSVRLVLGLLAANFALYGLVTVLAELAGNGKVLWLREWSGGDFSGAFFYRNHGGAFLYLGVAVLLAGFLELRFRHQDPLRRSRFPPEARFPFLLGALLCAAAAILTTSRGATLTTFGLLGLLPFLFLLAGLWERPAGFWTEWLVLLLLPAGLILLTVYLAEGWQVFARLDSLQSVTGTDARLLGMGLSLEMWQSRPLFGYGADSYQQAVALFQDRVTELGLGTTGREVNRLRWVAAHNDGLELLVQLGWVGALPVFASLLFWLGLFFRYLLRWTVPLLTVSAGLLLLLAHSGVELIFQSGTLLLTFSTLLALVGVHLRAEGGGREER